MGMKEMSSQGELRDGRIMDRMTIEKLRNERDAAAGKAQLLEICLDEVMEELRNMMSIMGRH